MDFSAVDVADLIKRLDLGDVDQNDRARLTSGGQEIHFECFGPEHGDGGSAYINIETTAWMCHGCKRRGNAIHLVMEVQQVDRPTAERFLRENYGIDFREPDGGSMVAELDNRLRPQAAPPDPVRPPHSFLSSVRLDWAVGPFEPFQQYMLGRGFTPSTMSEWDVGYDYTSNRLTIPVFDIGESLFGIKGRAWEPGVEPKYRVLGDVAGMTRFGFTPYDPKEVVFGLHRRRDVRWTVLCEGELNAMALEQLGIPRPTATGMSYFTQRHAQLLAREVDEVVLFYDYGPAGHDGVWGRMGADGQFYSGAVQLLEPYVRTRVVQALPEDPSKLVELGRGDEALDLIESAPSSLVVGSSTVLR